MSTDSTDTRMISIGGHVGSGKSTIARILSERTGIERFSTGRIFRDMAERMGMSVLELNEYALDHREVDDEVDGHLRRIAENPRPLIIDSRMAFFFVPRSFKVYLVVDAEVGAERVYGAGRADESYTSVMRARTQGKERERVEAGRYHGLYGVLRDDWNHYDLVVDTTHASADQVAETVLAAVEDEDHPRPRCELGPRRMLPSRPPPPPPYGDALPQVVVARGTIVVAAGHDALARALVADETFVTAGLLAYEDDTLDDGLTAREFAQSAVNESDLDGWEERFGFAYTSRPDWL